MNTVIDRPASSPQQALGPDVRCHELAPGRPPLFIEPEGDALLDRARFRAWTRQARPTLEALIVAHGGIVLRGFPTPGTEDFIDLVDQFPAFDEGYIGGRAPRKAIAGKVLEATRLDEGVKLAVHSELAYRTRFPQRVAFFSHRTAPVGGETLIADARSVVDEMGPDLVGKIASLGTRSAMNYAPRSERLESSYENQDDVSWNHAFQTEDRAEVERLCAARGLQWVWHDDGTLTVFSELNPFLDHPKTGRRLYRSALHRRHTTHLALSTEIRKNLQYPTGMFLGAGQKLTPEEADRINAIFDRSTFSWPWRDGDIMVLDNLQVWHGRNPYSGPRDVQVALLD